MIMILTVFGLHALVLSVAAETVAPVNRFVTLKVF